MSKNNKKEPIFGLDKLPDKAYIKALEEEITRLNIEKGKTESYIDELSNDIVELKKLSQETLKELAKDKTIKELRKKVNKLEHKNYILVRDSKIQIEKILTLKKQLEDEKNR